MTAITKQIEELNCNWEGSLLDTYISVDVPFNINYSKVKEYLENICKEDKIDYSKACLSTVHKEQL